MKDLTVNYMGLRLKNPIIVASSGLTRSLEGVEKWAEAGAGAVVLKSIFEEQFWVEGGEKGLDYYPEIRDYLESGGLLDYAPQQIVKLIKEAKKRFDFPILASINGQTERGWIRFAQQLEDTGCDGLELNIYSLPLDPEKPGDKYESGYLKIVEKVRQVVSLPLAVKIFHQITSLPHFVRRLGEAGAQGVVLFNWFLEPDLDLTSLQARHRQGEANFNLVLRWIALLANRVKCDLAASGGVKGSEEALKLILAGASAVQVCRLLYQKGPAAIREIINEINNWLEEHKYSRLTEIQGKLSLKEENLRIKGLGEATAYLRAQYIRLHSGK